LSTIPADEALRHSSQPEDHGTLIFAQHIESHRREHNQQDQHNKKGTDDQLHRGLLSFDERACHEDDDKPL
jgi:hypothetical protein